MKTKRSLCLIMCLVVLGVQVSEAQFLKRVKDAVKKEANKVVDKISNENKEESNKDNKAEKPSTNQESNKEKEEDTRTIINNGLTYSPPNDNFRAFSLQKHNGLPRFGVLNSFGTKKPINSPIGYEIYSQMLLLKYGNMLNHSLALNTASSETYLKYFCNEGKGDCSENKRHQSYIKSRGVGAIDLNDKGSGAGIFEGANQFEKERKKSEYMEHLAPILEKWSANLWPNSSEIAYIVDRENLGEYDFDKGGYWLKSIAHPIGKGTGLISNTIHLEYLPENRFEKEMEKGWILLKVNTIQAEKLANSNIRSIYSVVKIKLAFHKKESLNKFESYKGGSRVLFKYNYENPAVEFYEDEGLTNKIGEISYEDVEHSSSMLAPNDTRFKN